MCSGGLGFTDKGNSVVIGGLAHEFFLRNGQRYNQTTAYYQLEPHGALEIFQDMLTSAGVSVIYNEQVATVTKIGAQLVSITTVSGKQLAAAIFIDASYEGDLLARAAISFTIGREGRSVYNEPLAGNRGGADGHQFMLATNPLDMGGIPLPLLPQTSADVGNPGEGDTKVQAYNFRLCATQAANRVPWPFPPSYRPATWELARRYFANHTDQPFAASPVPNNKFDVRC